MADLQQIIDDLDSAAKWLPDELQSSIKEASDLLVAHQESATTKQTLMQLALSLSIPVKDLAERGADVVRGMKARIEQLESEPSIDDCISHRCSKHYKAPVSFNLNDGGKSECGACIREDTIEEAAQVAERCPSIYSDHDNNQRDHRHGQAIAVLIRALPNPEPPLASGQAGEAGGDDE